MRRTLRNCKVDNFCIREARVVSLSDLVRERHVELSCVWFFAVIVSERVTFRDDSL